MPDPAVLSSLRDRLRAASGPDRILDFQIRRLFEGKPVDIEMFWTASPEQAVKWENGDRTDEAATPYFTTSVDAALALVEKLKPECGISLIRFDYGPRNWQAEVEDGLASASTAPLAILDALLSALLQSPADEASDG